MEILLLIMSFIFGTCIGSFLNVVVWRLPREEKLTGRSHCASCLHKLAWTDLFPLLSFVRLGGRCNYCHKKISYRYPLVEILVGLLFALCYWHYMPSNILGGILFLKSLVAVSFLVAIFSIDLEHYLILDSLVFPGTIVLAVINFILDAVSHRAFFSVSSFGVGGFVGAVVALVPFLAIWYFSDGKWMGFGDVKFMLFLGMLLGWPMVGVGLFIAVMLGGLGGIILLAFGGKNLKSKVPFGTFLSVGAFLAMLWGNELFKWYLGILGI